MVTASIKGFVLHQDLGSRTPGTVFCRPKDDIGPLFLLCQAVYSEPARMLRFI